jgi:hypothetical protein
MMSYPLDDWRRQQLLEEAEAERLAAQLPRHTPQLHIRRRLAHVLLALANWLSPDVFPSAPPLRLARATRRNGTV